MHANARLTIHGRRLLIDRIQSGRPVAHVATEMGVSSATAWKWWRRFRLEGDPGLWDRSSRPRRSPFQTPRRVERRVVQLRRSHKLGPARIAGILEMPASTVHRVLVRAGLNRLSWMDRPTGQVIRRYEKTHPGELVHVDVKKLGRIPTGGGWRAHGRAATRHGREARAVGYAYVHAAVDDYSRVAYCEVLGDERADTAIGFWSRANHWFAQHGVTVERVLTDNGACYKRRFSEALDALGIRHSRTRPYRPQTNGKVERFNRTLADTWAYVRVYRSDAARTAALEQWLHTYNHHRTHTAIGGQPPISRLNNLPGQYT
jgi:transposase InsO family protein